MSNIMLYDIYDDGELVDQFTINILCNQFSYIERLLEFHVEMPAAYMRPYDGGVDIPVGCYILSFCLQRLATVKDGSKGFYNLKNIMKTVLERY